MALLLTERTFTATCDLLLGDRALRVGCQITAEWLRGIAEPTWYGYLVSGGDGLRLLPGRYRLKVLGTVADILVRRPTPMGEELCFPFWGLGAPPLARPADNPPMADDDLDALVAAPPASAAMDTPPC